MKSVLCLLLLCITALSGVFARAHADDLKITGAHAANQLGLAQNSFTWDETPYLKSLFSFSSPLPQIREIWSSPSGHAYTSTITDNSSRDLDKDPAEILNTLLNWDNKREYGEWAWSAKALNGDSTSPILTGNFTVTHAPEPCTFILFSLGAATLGLRKLRTNK